eukprot:TRINITY_DN19944_c0_g2_i1.p1 TRINITY_DN19944_c0_g2~~TRINITY_DN19944_c0_g2_i1.p1  ORF type:complete len:1742 (-),score=234.93 TRINITY_DN19944_c0_g2_i1:108-5333(-)
MSTFQIILSRRFATSLPWRYIFFLGHVTQFLDAAQVIPKPLNAAHRGTWYYEPPVENVWYFGQFLYVSPMGTNCLRNLTVYVPGAVCQAPFVSQDYWASLSCMPDGLEMLATLVDGWNANPNVLKDTCLQLASSQYNYESDAPFGGRLNDLDEILRKEPTKHGIVAFQQLTTFSKPATAAGIPMIEVGTSASVIQDVGVQSQFQTTYRIRTDASWMFEGALKRILPKKFALVLEELTASAMGAAIEAAASRQNSTIGFTAIVPENRVTQTRTDMAMRAFVRELIRKQLRYVLVLAPFYGLIASLLCALWRENAHTFIQAMWFGNANDPELAWGYTECFKDPTVDLKRLMEQTGLMSFMPQFLLGVDDDLRVNLASGSQGRTEPGAVDLMGKPWAFPALNAAVIAKAYYNTTIPGCEDNDAAINASPHVRAALLLTDGETIDCSSYMVMALGQGNMMSYVKEVAKHCPISACSYNPLMTACRLSRCCPVIAGALNSSAKIAEYPGFGGGPVCIAPSGAPQVVVPQLQKCEARSCRPLAWGSSSSEMTYKGFGFATYSLCRPPCIRHPILHLVFLGVSHPSMDAFWALATAYACVEQKRGSAGLDRLANNKHYRDAEIATELQWCMENAVDFDGVTGRINFKYSHSPSPANSVVYIAQPHTAVGGITATGSFIKDDALLMDRVFYRKNYTECEASRSFMPPSLLCPVSSTVEFELGRNNETGPRGFPESCPLGEYPLPIGKGIELGEIDAFRCVPCPAGTSKSSNGDQLCLPCPAGFSASAGQSRCNLCLANQFSQEPPPDEPFLDGRSQTFGPVACLPCANGSVSTSGSASCTDCMAGTYRDASMSECMLCPAGRFQNQTGSSECVSCGLVLPGSSGQQGARSSEECICSEGMFMKPGKGCESCLTGMLCPGGNSMPLQEKGAYAQIIDEGNREFSVYYCRNINECPQGPPQTCAEGRDAGDIACNNCKVNFHKAAKGECEECSELDKMPFLFILAGVFGLGAVMTVVMKVDMSKQRLSSLTVIMTGGQLITALQALGAVSQLAIDWQEPVRTFMELLALLTLDFDVANMSCLVQENSPVAKFAMQLVTYPFLLATLTTGFFLSKLTKSPVTLDSFWNLNGSILFVLFISMTLAMLGPLQCLENPNGLMSVAENPGIVCWRSSEHAVLSGLSILGIVIYPVAILAWAGWTTLQYPSRIASGSGLMLNVRYRFLFGRFRPEHYYFGLLYLVRNMVIALVPVVFANTTTLQIVAMGAVLQWSAALQASLWPWRTLGSNLSDLAISQCLGLVLLGAAPLLEVNDSSMLANLIFTVVMLLFLAGLAVIGHAVYSRFRPPRAFGAFLCHHKAGAGSLCRYMKTVASKHSSSVLFLDSDELESLDLIFDTVRCATKALVAVLSPELLHRMWCAGEIVTAHTNEVFMLPILCDGYNHPDGNRIHAIGGVWTEEQKHTLISFGISMEMVQNAYHHLVKLPSLAMPRFGSSEQQEDIVVKMLDLCKLPRRAFITKSERTESAPILITGSVADAEALSTTYVVQAYMQKIMQQECVVVRDARATEKALDSAVYMLVLFAKGMLRDPSFAEVLLTVTEGSEGSVEIVTVSADTGFEFPGPEFYKELEIEGLREVGLGPAVGVRLSQAFRSLLSVLALPLSPLGSHGLIEKQLNEISRRFRKLSDTSGREKRCSWNSQGRVSIRQFIEDLEKARADAKVFDDTLQDAHPSNSIGEPSGMQTQQVVIEEMLSDTF